MNLAETRVKQLLQELDGASLSEAKDIALELADIAILVIQSTNQSVGLAEAVVAFADWHKDEYKVTSDTKKEISRSLWYEVSDRVYAITGTTPSNPCGGAADIAPH